MVLLSLSGLLLCFEYQFRDRTHQGACRVYCISRLRHAENPIRKLCRFCFSIEDVRLLHLELKFSIWSIWHLETLVRSQVLDDFENLTEKSA